MRSVVTQRFWDLFRKLPRNVQALAVKNYQVWKVDPHHPSLHFRRLQGSEDRYTVRVGEHHRALAKMTADEIIWVWIGTHAEYDRVIGR